MSAEAGRETWFFVVGGRVEGEKKNKNKTRNKKGRKDGRGVSHIIVCFL